MTRTVRSVLAAALGMMLCAVSASAARTVTDELGRTMTVPDHPHRIVCLVPSITDDVYALGAGDDVIAVSDYTKYPAEARLKPSVGLPLSPSIETILALHPDLVLGSSDHNRIASVDRLQQMGIPVFMVDPHGIAGIYKSLHTLGQALHREEAAESLIHQLHQREQAVRLRVQGKPVVSIFMPIWYDPIVTIGEHAFISELIDIAGGHSITSDIHQEWPQVSLEAIIARRPEGLLLVRGARMSLSDLTGRPGWDMLPAMKNHRFYYVDDRIDLPAPVAFDALEELAAELHP
ncbi:ABC transporter substrate-binding protein [Paracidobacterium acidisoli]|uniref:Cobalamin-binding protein n=1 Tax=Paracidobacterium acidisoli TaxID=2303751 RepID=A0A372IQY1_9BACT|nr:cobalamin-binding protein [Paracidobacterium acidisoli]MBT9331258.1 cobalamin-binding protein [Paracidobacterium acidisoli]